MKFSLAFRHAAHFPSPDALCLTLPSPPLAACAPRGSVGPQGHLCSVRETFRLFFFADPGANRVTRPERILGEVCPERPSPSSLEVLGSEIQLPLPEGSPRHKLRNLRIPGKSALIAVPGKTLSPKSDSAEKQVRARIFLLAPDMESKKPL